MSVIQGIQNIVRSTRVSQAGGSASGQTPYATLSPEAHSDLLRARTELLNLYRDIEKLAELTNINVRFKLDLPDARSASALGLDMTHTAATLNSADEINASPMSFTPFGPAWDDGSSALITIGGEYHGTHGTGPITFEVRRAGTHGVNDLRIRVEDSLGNRIKNINVRSNHAEDRQYSLNNGLYLTLGPGSVSNRDFAQIQVNDNVGAVVDADLPLGGVRNQNPNLQFGLPGIVDGGFDLNGENISVSTSDTLNDVVQTINQSNAGVTAVFNALTERIEFVQNTLGSAPTVDLQNDTSNFLEATKLDSLNVIDGIDPETIKTLDAVGTFSAVQSGDIIINGQPITIDTVNDSLSTVLANINGSGAGVIATFDSASQLVVIEASDSASVLEIDGNGTGLFTALKIPEGRVDPEAVSRGISRKRSYEIADAANAVFEKMNRIFRDSTFLGRGSNAGQFRAPIEAALRSAFGEASGADILGFSFNSSANARLRGDFTTIDRRELTSNLQRRGNLVRDFLAGSDDQGGLVQGLLSAAENALGVVNQTLGLSGTFVDTFA
ncbi:MAG: hypothetical protein GY783_10670 [Gammaproteobacteria bacterium]|nr:hypothetical protein [Gammaproteobacteria bacterium]